MDTVLFQEVGEVAQVLAFAFFLALVVERVIEFVVKPLLLGALKAALKDEERAKEKAGLVIPYVAFGFGAALAWGFGLDLFAGLAAAVGLEPATWFTLALTAIVVGGGSNLMHDLWPQTIELEIEADLSAAEQVTAHRP